MRRFVLIAPLLASAPLPQAGYEGRWRAVLDLEGGTLPFELMVQRVQGHLVASICNGPACDTRAEVVVRGAEVTLDIADYAATINATRRGDSLSGTYHNVGRNGPRSIPFRASRGAWTRNGGSDRLAGSWDGNGQFSNQWTQGPGLYLPNGLHQQRK